MNGQRFHLQKMEKKKTEQCERSLRASPTVPLELKLPVELNSFSDASISYWRQKMNSIQRKISTLRKQ